VPATRRAAQGPLHCPPDSSRSYVRSQHSHRHRERDEPARPPRLTGAESVPAACLLGWLQDRAVQAANPRPAASRLSGHVKHCVRRSLAQHQGGPCKVAGCHPPRQPPASNRLRPPGALHGQMIGEYVKAGLVPAARPLRPQSQGRTEGWPIPAQAPQGFRQRGYVARIGRAPLLIKPLADLGSRPAIANSTVRPLRRPQRQALGVVITTRMLGPPPAHSRSHLPQPAPGRFETGRPDRPASKLVVHRQPGRPRKRSVRQAH